MGQLRSEEIQAACKSFILILTGLQHGVASVNTALKRGENEISVGCGWHVLNPGAPSA